MQSDFLTSKYGNVGQARWRRYRILLRALDWLYDRRIMRFARVTAAASQSMDSQRILLAGVKVPGRENCIERVINGLISATVQQVTVSVVPMGNRGKFENINLALADHDLSNFDWVMIVDDDISVPPAFLDAFLFTCVRHKLQLAQPAHRFRSYASYSVTRRHWASMARLTNFVEIGPVTLIRSDLFSHLMPFPELKYGWGLDVLWAEIAKQKEWRLGIVDAAPIGHLNPVGRSYDNDAAIKEAESFLGFHKVAVRRPDILGRSDKLS
jgi:hypothetical protein